MTISDPWLTRRVFSNIATSNFSSDMKPSQKEHFWCKYPAFTHRLVLTSHVGASDQKLVPIFLQKNERAHAAAPPSINSRVLFAGSAVLSLLILAGRECRIYLPKT